MDTCFHSFLRCQICIHFSIFSVSLDVTGQIGMFKELVQLKYADFFDNIV